MQKLSIAAGVAAIVAALVTLYCLPKIHQIPAASRNKVVRLLIMVVLFGIAWVILCYVVALGMYFLGMW